MKNQTITITERQLTLAFAQWERRYRDHPENFQSEATKLKKEQPETYGAKCAAFIFVMLERVQIAERAEALAALAEKGATSAEVAAATTP